MQGIPRGTQETEKDKTPFRYDFDDLSKFGEHYQTHKIYTFFRE